MSEIAGNFIESKSGIKPRALKHRPTVTFSKFSSANSSALIQPVESPTDSGGLRKLSFPVAKASKRASSTCRMERETRSARICEHARRCMATKNFRLRFLARLLHAARHAAKNRTVFPLWLFRGRVRFV